MGFFSSTTGLSTQVVKLGRKGMRPWLFLGLVGIALSLPTAALIGMIGSQLGREYESKLKNLKPDTRLTASSILEEVHRQLAEIEDRLLPDFTFAPRELNLSFFEDMPHLSAGSMADYAPEHPIIRRVAQCGKSPFFDGSGMEPSNILSAPGSPSEAWTRNAERILALDDWALGEEFEPFLDVPRGLAQILGFLYAQRPNRDEMTHRIEMVRERVAETSITVTYGTSRWWWLEDGGNALLTQMVRVNDLWAEYGEFRFQSDLGDELERTFWILQGFEVDRDWLFDLIESSAANALGPAERLCRPGDTERVHPQDVRVALDAHRLLGIEDNDPRAADFEYAVLADSSEIRKRLRRGWLQILGLGGFLIASVATGLFLVGSSVRRELLRAERMDAFTAAVSHELRTPLATIGLSLDMLRQGLAHRDQHQEYYDRIAGQRQRLEQLVDGILERARLTSGGGYPASEQSTEVDLSALIQRTGGDLSEIPGPKLEFDLALDLPPVLAPPSALNRILSNLVENARKYGIRPPKEGEPSPVLISTRFERGRVMLEVADRGPGIAPRDRSRIFEPFVRIPSPELEGAPGTGLGLHLVSLQASSLQATLAVFDRPGGGAVFQVGFPPAPPDSDAP